jgi:hypothetical protein
MELDPESFDADMICAAVEGDDDGDQAESVEADAVEAVGASPAASPLPSLYRLSEGEPAPGATVHYQFCGLVEVDTSA